jgi:hypothetical protein
MDDVRHSSAPPSWIEALDRAEADVAAGRVVDGVEIHADLSASIERMRPGKGDADPSRSRQKR